MARSSARVCIRRPEATTILLREVSRCKARQKMFCNARLDRSSYSSRSVTLARTSFRWGKEDVASVKATQGGNSSSIIHKAICSPLCPFAYFPSLLSWLTQNENESEKIVRGELKHMEEQVV